MESVLPGTTAIFRGAVFVLGTIAAGVVAADLHETLTQGERRPGAWHTSARPGPAVRKLNTRTGALFYCTRARSCSLVATK